MNNTEKMIVQSFEDRFEQVKGISEFLKTTSEESVETVKKVKESEETDPAKFTADAILFKKNQVSISMLNQQLQSLIGRMIEYYTIIKMSELPTSLTAEDEKFLEGFMKQKLDLFGVEKGNLVVLDKEFHDNVMQSVSQLQDGEIDQIVKFMKTQ